jgi:hypothetical protein
MRIRGRRKAIPPREPLPLEIEGAGEIVVTTSSHLSIDQLNAAGPSTGPSHRTFVPIVRNTLRES